MMSQPHLMKDPYSALGDSMSFMQRLEHLYRVLREQYDGIHRFALALYDEEDEVISSFIYESDEGSPLMGYRLPLAQVPSLRELAHSGAVRIVDDMRVFRHESSASKHSDALLQAGLRSSFTMVLRQNSKLRAFLFLNSHKPGYFKPAMAAYCNMWGHFIEQLLMREHNAIGRLQSLINFATDISGRRSVETDGHVKRMALYARLIARGLQQSHELSDDFIEYVTLFAPMHDIGKVAIEDSILHKSEALTDEEFERMRRHVTIGQDIVDKAFQEFSLGELAHSDMLRNIVLFHHEKINGGGYLGCEGQDEIPIEARIVAVADVLDALLSKRSYKEPWPLEKALAELQRLAVDELDQACVNVIVANAGELSDIQQRHP